MHDAGFAYDDYLTTWMNTNRRLEIPTWKQEGWIGGRRALEAG